MEQESLGAYIKRYRLEKSASLLQYTRLNLDEIAAATGYSGKHAFSKAFGAVFGRSPGAFRKKTPFFKFAANMIMDGIDSEPEYFRLLRDRVSCNWRITELKGLSMICSMVGYFPASPALSRDYDAFIRSALEDTASIQGGDTIIKFFDAPNYTHIRRFKAEHGVLVPTAVLQQPPPPLGYFQVHPLREGRYLVFEITRGPAQNEGELITRVRDNLIGYNKLFSLTDLYAFYRLKGRERTPGEYYIWLDNG